METLTRRIEYKSRSDVFSIWFRGDKHVGNVACDEEAIQETVRKIKQDPLSLVFDVGDDGEFIAPSDFRFRMSSLADWVFDAYKNNRGGKVKDSLSALLVDRIAALDEPIKDKIVGKIRGNHEDKIAKSYDTDVYAELCSRLGLRALGDEAIVRLVFDRGGHSTALTLYLHHGFFAGRKPGSKVNNLFDLLGDYCVDVVAVGHGHDRAMTIRVAHGLDRNGRLVTWRRYGVMTGSYLRTRAEGVTTYAAKRGYRTTDTGAVRLFFSPDDHTLWGEL